MDLDRLLFQALVNLMDLADAFAIADEPSPLISERMFTKMPSRATNHRLWRL
jgi:hypothetical protein